MAIYSRGGRECRIVRVATLDDVRKLDGRKPDKQDRDAIASGSYVVVAFPGDAPERLYHQAFLRADGGSREITEAIEAVTVTAAERHIMEHALGLPRSKVPYRNHFVTGPGSTDWEPIQSLVGRGFMRVARGPSEISGGDHVFSVTVSGMRAIGLGPDRIAALEAAKGAGA